jgi:hypothetical protein
VLAQKQRAKPSTTERQAVSKPLHSISNCQTSASHARGLEIVLVKRLPTLREA